MGPFARRAENVLKKTHNTSPLYPQNNKKPPESRGVVGAAGCGSSARRGRGSSELGIVPNTPIMGGCWQVTGGLMRFESSGELTEKSILGTARPELPAPGQRDPFPAPRQDLGSTGAWRRCRALGAGQAGTARRGRGGCLPGADVTDGEAAVCPLQAGTRQRDARGEPRASILHPVPPTRAQSFPGANSEHANQMPVRHLHPTAMLCVLSLGFPSGMSPSFGDATRCWLYPAKPRHQHLREHTALMHPLHPAGETPNPWLPSIQTAPTRCSQTQVHAHGPQPGCRDGAHTPL